MTFGRGASACPQSSPQSPNTSHLWLVMRHSFQGCLTFYSLAPTTGLFQDQYTTKLLEGLGSPRV